jgi:hypothetical protein
VADCVISVLGLVQASIIRRLERRTRIYSIALFIIMIVHASCNLVWNILREHSDGAYNTLSRIAVFIESLMLSALMVLLTGFLLDQSHVKNRKRSITFYVVAGLWLVYFGMLVYAQFSSEMYYIEPSNEYGYGPYFPLLQLPLILIMLLNLLLYFRRQNYLNDKQKIAFAIYLIMPLAVLIVEMFVYDLPLMTFALSISAIVMFILRLRRNSWRSQFMPSGNSLRSAVAQKAVF